MSRKKFSNRIPYLSVIIPLCNEQRRVNNLLKIYEYLKKSHFRYEIIVVNDGSVDNTLRELKKYKRKFKFNLISYNPNRGKGYAIKIGMQQAKGKYRLFIDIDLSTSMAEFDKILPYLKKHDVIIGSRKTTGSVISQRQSYMREFLGRVFTNLSKTVLNISISDFTCGFKCFSKKATEQIFNRQTINRWGFDSEILYIAHSKGFLIKEIPVFWKNDQGTKVKLPQDIITALLDLIKIRLNASRGKYN